METKNRFKGFFLSIIIPVLLTIFLFIISIFIIIIPEFEQNIINRKREMLRELTNSTVSILSKLNIDEQASLLSKDEAQKQAINKIEFLRYGKENKDYFWIINQKPVMIMHPYITELNGTDLSDFVDAHGKKLFVEVVDTIQNSKEGFVDYMWQWKDDSTKIVPKLSYVKLFEPWGWIIGTGIYIEDVKEEISEIENRLLRITLVITALIVFLLLIILVQSFRIEKKRIKAEDELNKSNEKHKTLVESFTQGTLMIFIGQIIYSNKIIEDMIGYSNSELQNMSIFNLFLKNNSEDSEAMPIFENSNNKNELNINQSKLITKNKNIIDVEIICSKMQLAKDEVYVLKIKEQSAHKKEFVKDMDKFKLLTDNIKIGIFRATLGTKSKIIEANRALLDLIGIEKINQLANTSIFDLFNDKADKKSFLIELNTKGSVKNKIIRLKRQNSTINIIAVSAVLVLDENGDALYCDGVIEDITEQKQAFERQESLITELQTSLLFLSQPLKNFTNLLPICNYKNTVSEATQLMTKNNSNSILISSDDDSVIGIITDSDIRKRFVAESLSLDTQIFEIMSSPIISISDGAMLFEAISLMQEKQINHLAVKDGNDQIISILNNEDLLMVHRNSVSFLKREIEIAKNIEQIATIQKRLPLLISTLIAIGANSNNITKLTSIVFDTILKKLISFALNDLGKPPAKFAFIVLGSAGRDEQTLVTDQDNVIIYENTCPEKEVEVSDYFLNFGDKVCNWLHDVGYNLCQGDIMAKNPKWNTSLDIWKGYFRNWILKSEPEDLLNINIFLDLRTIYGEKSFVNEIQENIFKYAEEHKPFLIYITENAHKYKQSINFFGNIVLGSSKDNPHSFDIKNAMITLIDFARIYSIKYKVTEINTQKRIKKLREENIITEQTFKDFVNAYDFLMQIRFKHQIELIQAQKEPNNFINPDKLSSIEQSLLKKILVQINDYLSKLNYEIKGSNINM